MGVENLRNYKFLRNYRRADGALTRVRKSHVVIAENLDKHTSYRVSSKETLLEVKYKYINFVLKEKKNYFQIFLDVNVKVKKGKELKSSRLTKRR